MPNLDAYINEVLRVHGPAPTLLARKAVKDHYIGDFFVPKGSQVHCVIALSFMNEDNFENPKLFDPKRFLDEFVVKD